VEALASAESTAEPIAHRNLVDLVEFLPSLLTFRLAISLESIQEIKESTEPRQEPVVQIQPFSEHLTVVMVEPLVPTEVLVKVAVAALHPFSQLTE
jgi:hypothetical protein